MQIQIGRICRLSKALSSFGSTKIMVLFHFLFFRCVFWSFPLSCLFPFFQMNIGWNFISNTRMWPFLIIKDYKFLNGVFCVFQIMK